MPKLIALIDGSDYSISVCDHTAWVATRAKASVEIIHCLARRDDSNRPTDISGSIGLGARTSLLQELAELDAQSSKLANKRGRAVLEDAKSRIKKAGVKQVTTKLRNDDIVDALQEFEPDADLIIVGKRGQAADFAKLHLGSNLERIARASSKPVLVTSRAFKPIKKFLIAFDGGKSAMKAVEHLAKSIVFAGLDCHILTVGADTPTAKQSLRDAETMLKSAGYNVSAEILAGQADRVIAEKVGKDAIDLLVIGAYGHSRIRALVIGSTTTEMIRSCKIPLLLFR